MKQLWSGTARPGFALVLSMLLVMALAVVAMGMLAVGTREQWIAGAVTRNAEARRAAEAAVIEAVRDWSTRAVADMDVGASRSVALGAGRDGVLRSATIERIDLRLFRLRAEARVAGPDGVTQAAAAVLVHTLSGQALGAVFAGALSADGTVTINGGTIQGGPASGGPCRRPGPGVTAPTVDPISGGVSGDPPVQRADPPPFPRPDPFGATMAPALAAVRYQRRTAAPRPRTARGECEEAATNWGSPDPTHPCYDALPVIVAEDLILMDGTGRGTLIVFGDLQVTGTTRFEGLVVVHGHLELRDDAVLRGAVRATSATIDGGSIIRDDCAVEAATTSPGFDGPFRDPVRWWVPAF